MSPPEQSQPPPQPTGLLALILLPLQAALGAGLRLFAALISGILRALLPGSPGETGEEPEAEPGGESAEEQRD
jgi:hypothetical protein